mmetsp:Transcript_8185/g.17907  ORF Transcript_8185/g.17907 Transcript_8185/m.17907 type:complete len:263 (-) Transcript_8185:166-954(-)
MVYSDGACLEACRRNSSCSLWRTQCKNGLITIHPVRIQHSNSNQNCAKRSHHTSINTKKTAQKLVSQPQGWDIYSPVLTIYPRSLIMQYMDNSSKANFITFKNWKKTNPLKSAMVWVRASFFFPGSPSASTGQQSAAKCAALPPQRAAYAFRDAASFRCLVSETRWHNSAVTSVPLHFVRKVQACISQSGQGVHCPNEIFHIQPACKAHSSHLVRNARFWPSRPDDQSLLHAHYSSSQRMKQAWLVVHRIRSLRCAAIHCNP